MISIQNLSKRFGAQQVLKNITIKLHKGQV